MSDSENPRCRILVQQNWALWRQSMRMARNLMKAELPTDFHEREMEERYYAFMPMIAMNIRKDMGQDSAFLSQAPESMQTDRITGMNAMVNEMKAFNDLVEKDLPKE